MMREQINAAVRKDGESQVLESEEYGPTGTSFSWHPNTFGETFAVLQISRSAPLRNPDGTQFFESTLFTQHSNYAQNHDIKIADRGLFPGNRFWALLRLVDRDGRWQYRNESFTTWSRSIQILPKEVRVLNDGAEGNNSASFRIWVTEGRQFVSACHLSEREISDRPSPGEKYQEHIALSADCQINIGSTVVVPDGEFANEKVAILTRGIASVTIGTDDISGNFLPNNGFPARVPRTIFSDAFLWLPIGRDRERGEDLEFQIYARPFTVDNEFSYEVQGSYSVNYRP